MADLDDIPDNVKWQLAAKWASLLPVMYESAFRGVIGKKYDEIEQEIWMELSRMAQDIVRNLSLPAGTAYELAESYRIVMSILFGPEYKSETLEISKDSAVILVKRCPLPPARGYGTETEGIRTFNKCMAFTLTAIPGLNTRYSVRFVRTMCTGDRQCEIKIEPAEQEKDIKNKKAPSTTA